MRRSPEEVETLTASSQLRTIDQMMGPEMTPQQLLEQVTSEYVKVAGDVMKAMHSNTSTASEAEETRTKTRDSRRRCSLSSTHEDHTIATTTNGPNVIRKESTDS